MNSLKVSYVELENKGDVDVTNGLNEDLDWNTFVSEELSFCHRRDNKDGNAFIPAKFKNESDWVLKGRNPNYRNDENVESLTMVVLDIDDASGLDKTLDMFGEFEHVMYSTHSYNSSTQPHKMRMVLPLQEPLTVEQWYETFDKLKHCIDIDPSCRNASRMYYYHSMPKDQADTPIFNVNSGQALDYSSLNKIIRRFINGLDDTAKDEVKALIAKGNKPIHRRHFSDGRAVAMYQHRQTNLTPDFSYEGFVSRHKKLIEDELSGRCFDNFSLKASKRDIQNFGKALNIDALIQFIVRASVEFTNSNHVLTANSDTLNSLFVKISGAIHKYQPEWFKSINMPNMQQDIENSIASARVKAHSGKWSFPAPVTGENHQNQPSRQQSALKSNTTVIYSEALMRSRNREAILQFAGDKMTNASVRLFDNVFSNECRINPESIQVNKVSEFIFKQLQRYYSKMHPELGPDDIKNMLELDRDVLLKNASNSSSRLNSSNEFLSEAKLMASIKRGFACTQGLIKPSLDENTKNSELAS